MEPTPQVLILEEQEMEPLAGIDVSTWEKNDDGLWIVPEAHHKDVLSQCYDSLVAGHWGRNRIRGMVSHNFI